MVWEETFDQELVGIVYFKKVKTLKLEYRNIKDDVACGERYCCSLLATLDLTRLSNSSLNRFLIYRYCLKVLAGLFKLPRLACAW